jgi:nucleoside-diphosphate-sugar epimerase
MHITVVAASPRTAQATIRHLLADASAPAVKGIYRNLSRVPEEFKANTRFEAVKGDIEDGASLDFSGSDAVFVVEPPIFDERDTVQHTKDVSENVKAAIQRAQSVKRLVLLSSVGAQYDHGIVSFPFPCSNIRIACATLR